jgi:hypothetical protein
VKNKGRNMQDIQGKIIKQGTQDHQRILEGTRSRFPDGYRVRTNGVWVPCETPKPSDHNTIEHPSHYRQGKYECIDVIEDWKLSFHLGNCLKYLCRAEHKGKEIEDLKKARWYLDRQIALKEKEMKE